MDRNFLVAFIPVRRRDIHVKKQVEKIPSKYGSDVL